MMDRPFSEIIKSHVWLLYLEKDRVGRKPDARLFYHVRKLLTNRGTFMGQRILSLTGHVSRSLSVDGKDQGMRLYCCLFGGGHLVSQS